MTEERRRDQRLQRPLIVSYQLCCDPNANYDVTQIKDISLGGMRFVTSESYPAETLLSIELRTPFREERLKLKASVIESKEIAANLIYETRVRFVDLDNDTREALSKTISVLLKKDFRKEDK